jgi:hypothetical protein
VYFAGRLGPNNVAKARKTLPLSAGIHNFFYTESLYFYHTGDERGREER